jgi:hypothetical protein
LDVETPVFKWLIFLRPSSPSSLSPFSTLTEKTYTLQLVVDEQLRSHGDKTKHVNKSDQGLEDVRVPALVFIIVQRVNGVTSEEGIGDPAEITVCHFVVFLGLALLLRDLLSIFLQANSGDHGARDTVYFILESLEHLPDLDEQSETLTYQNHPRSFLVVIHEVKENDNLEKDVDHDSSDRYTGSILLLSPERNVCLKKGKKEKSRLLVYTDTSGHFPFTSVLNHLPLLKAKNSKRLCKRLTKMVVPSKMGLVSRSMRFISSISADVDPPIGPDVCLSIASSNTEYSWNLTMEMGANWMIRGKVLYR